jgi:hypothetical protein
MPLKPNALGEGEVEVEQVLFAANSFVFPFLPCRFFPTSQVIMMQLMLPLSSSVS